MCIVCRKRSEQESLYRFHFRYGKLTAFLKNGRSIYICPTCICHEPKKLVRVLNGKLKTKYKKIEDFGEYFSKCVPRHNKEIG